MLNRLSSMGKMVLESCSPRYSQYIASTYWNNAELTHGNMSEEKFLFYYNEIKKIIAADKRDEILDYGCGSGEISFLFHKDGFKIDCCDISRRLVEKAANLGLNAYLCQEILSSDKKYDKIYMNNAYFYIHPQYRRNFLSSISLRLKDGGSFFVLDEPDHTKRKKLNMSKMRYLVTHVLPVYQVEMAGFFDKPERTKNDGEKAGFNRIEVMNSWCNYRSHFKFYK